MLKVSFLGDIALNNDYISLYENDINPFKEIAHELEKSDFVIGNLECLAEGEKGENLLKKPRLKTSLDTLNYLKSINISAITLAHNHVYDNLEDGFDKTVNFLNKNNIQYFGAGYSVEASEKPLFLEKDGIKICLLNYVTEDTNPNLPHDSTLHLNLFDEKKIILDIKKNKHRVDYIVLLLHWGGQVEHGSFPDYDQPKVARKFIDEGANLIIGHHSHTVQPFEVYKDKYIFYSLGNFCFSDVYHENKLHYKLREKNKVSIVVNIKFYKANYDVEVLQIRNKNHFIELNGKKNSHKSNILFALLKKNVFCWKLYYIYLKKIDPLIYFFFYKDGKISDKILSLNRQKLTRYIKRK